MNKTKGLLISIFILMTSVWVQAAPMPEKEWTYLVYVNGHNNLDIFSDMNIIDMERVGSTANLNIVVEWGGESSITRRLYVEKSTNASKVTSPVLQELPNHDMGNYKNLQDFLEWGVKNYPAKHYFVAIWNHGSGWHGADVRKKNLNPVLMDISYDDNFNTFISTEEVGLVMAHMKKLIGRNIDIYGSDACLMQMIEVAGEMKDSVDYVVGSQDLEPGEGWPYYPLISQWAAQPQISPLELSKLLSKEYYDAYHGGIYGNRYGITFSVLDLSQMDAMYSAIADLTQQLIKLSPTEVKRINKGLLSTTHFTYDDYADLGDLMRQIRYLNFPSIDPALIDNVSAQLKNLVVVSNHDENDYPNASGISIWAPERSNSHQSRYENLMFSQATGWGQFTRLLAPPASGAAVSAR